MTVAKHEMRNHTVDRPVVRVLGVPGLRSVYRYTYGKAVAGALDVRHLGRSDNHVTHEWERECTVDRPLVCITGAGRLARITKGDDGFHRVEFDILAVANV
ncbi:hypothetical protein BKG71_00840 [Mycobacteroides chelonae]|nr:hypothetical protein BKG63_20195 [Mycobacteroides chelonae]OHT93880.1 hypothetical protein BKG72_16585 [Mycobacteroides chelonae]OHU02058.1 hypothetical protein BKG71_00840 [Mycobacteroides chelonae]OHU74015.1 hypothetical protein BKG87_01340 [Mycobacteroides chelonae]OLT90447.1 hypothetical protein BKG59_09735 [Mycobacteroides chelonae]